MKTGIIVTLLALAALSLAGCSSEPVRPGAAAACRAGLDAGFRELNFAKSNGFGGTMDYTRAAALLSAAKIQQQFDEYDNCVLKVHTARQYIRQSQLQH